VTAGVSLSFDVDGEAGLASRPGGPWERRLSSRSDARFGVARGVERVLRILEAAGVRATFYVPGRTVEQDPAVFGEVLAAGHEIAHHGYAHLPTHTLDPAGEREEIERGLAALGDKLGVTPAGYRSPAWELTPVTLELLGEHGFEYDSSLMGDDRPYRIRSAGRELVELPVHWSLDDVPYFANLADPAHVFAIWQAEHDIAVEEHRHLTFTMHPDIIGRPHRLELLRRLLEHIPVHHARTHGDVVRAVLEQR
jgi:peptidoglycan/xylan/chitin deacetylase (PgdA/CDA1 family)